ncbi:amidohydrolase family protein [Microbacterium sp. C7(2022)]|uniref:amidohydrolase family protein n=1 Tax=Microbacterium sp. C7(2022) TaxID=2992759 RepID=UPI00237A66DF|nr:amidohydrolase family protein [Microbacterium sp. C7(2022)]MDE0546322.1 amidohydrolase family protein [Microbacterium sp. C7(2022)]
MTAPVIVYSADLVVPITAPPIPHGAIAVRAGRILHVGDRSWVCAELASRGIAYDEVHWPGVITPGLVNAHTHLQYTGMAAVGAGTYSGFDAWDDAFTDAYHSGSDWRADAATGAALALAAGTTAIADVVTDPEAASALHDARVHGITYWEVMSWTNQEWAARGRAEVEARLDALPSPPGTGLSPHAPYSLDVQPLHEIPDIVRERGGRIHLHLGEAALEREFEHAHPDPWHSRRLGSFRELRGAGFGTGATEFVDQLGVLGPDCHIAHGVYMTARDRAILRSRGTTVALCPRSNAVIGLDEPPVAAYLVEGNPLAVGTDSLSSSPSLDLMADVAALHVLARSQGYTGRDLSELLLRAATLGGAHAMGLDTGPDRTGYLAVGALADLTFFDIAVTTVDDTIEHLVTAGTGTASATVISGEVRHASTAFTEQTGVTA